MTIWECGDPWVLTCRVRLALGRECFFSGFFGPILVPTSPSTVHMFPCRGGSRVRLQGTVGNFFGGRIRGRFRCGEKEGCTPSPQPSTPPHPLMFNPSKLDCPSFLHALPPQASPSHSVGRWLAILPLLFCCSSFPRHHSPFIPSLILLPLPFHVVLSLSVRSMLLLSHELLFVACFATKLSRSECYCQPGGCLFQLHRANPRICVFWGWPQVL